MGKTATWQQISGTANLRRLSGVKACCVEKIYMTSPAL